MGIEVAIGAAVVGGLFSAREQRKAQKAQQKAAKRANALARKREGIQAFRERVTAIRQQRSQVAGIEAAQAAQGVGSSQSAVATGALATGTATNISFANQLNQLAGQRQDVLQRGEERANRSLSRAQFGQVVSNIGTSGLIGG